MKNIVITVITCLCFSIFSFSNNLTPIQEKPKVGDTFIVAQNQGETYQHIDFPRLNILVKRGRIASYKSIYNIEVVVTDVIENEYGRVDVRLERTDGKKFFNLTKSVRSNYKKALENGELKVKA